MKSTLVVTIVSRYTLKRMVQGVHRPGSNDCVLVEWLICLECYKSHQLPGNQRVRGIYPIIIGTQTDDEILDIFLEDDCIISKLPLEVPEASVEQARRLLLANHIPFNEERLKAYTVKSIVSEITAKLGCKAWDIEVKHLSTEISEKIKRCLLETIASASSSAEIDRTSPASALSSSSSSSNSSSSPTLSAASSITSRVVAISSSLVFYATPSLLLVLLLLLWSYYSGGGQRQYGALLETLVLSPVSLKK